MEEDKKVDLPEEDSGEEIVDHEDDFSLETMAIKKSLHFRIPYIMGAITFFFLILSNGENQDFNPVHSPIFIFIQIFIILLCTTIYIYDYQIEPEMRKEKRVHRTYKRFSETLDFLSVVPYLVLFITVMNSFFISFSPISGTSMEPNYSDNEAVLFSHRWYTIERFDVIIIKDDRFEDPYLIKRVVGLPGETVIIDHGDVYIDSVLLEQNFIDQNEVYTLCTDDQSEYCEFDVPEGSYFVMGDNRDGNAVSELSGYSIDSRILGPIEEQNIYGKVILKFKDYNLFN